VRVGEAPAGGRSLRQYHRPFVLSKLLHRCGLRPAHMQGGSLASIALCIGLWIRAKTVDQDERGNAERRALFVGLWPPMFWLIGDSLERRELIARPLARPRVMRATLLGRRAGRV
jgi:hypothetical protein